jgi:glycosyltransferase involved in cell wall biosynthesis
VYHIVNACFVGRFGLADYTLSLARSIQTHCRSTIVSAQDFDYPAVPFSGEVIRAFRRSRHYPVDLVRFVVRMVKLRPDVVLFQSLLKVAFIDALAARLLRRFGIRVATTVHDVLPHYPRPWSRIELSFFYRSFDRLVAHSNAAQRQLRQMGVRAPILVVPHGQYDIYRISGITTEQARRKLPGLAADDFVVLFFGRIDTRKGIAELLTFVENQPPGGRLRLLLAGADGVSADDPALGARLRRLAASECCVARIERIPFDEVENYFSAADVVVLPYLEGTTSGVLKLAMAFGKPVVATDVGDVPETVEPGTGVVISHRRVVEELGPALARVRDDYATFARACLNVSEKYGWKSIGDRYARFLTEGLEQRH